MTGPHNESMLDAKLQAIERLIAEDAGARGIGPLVQWGQLGAAARALLHAPRVVIVCGFFIPPAMAGETDGPPGALALHQALAALGSEVVQLTDARNRPLLAALGLTPLYTTWAEVLATGSPTHLVGVERPGRAADGRYYNMRGLDISPFTEPLDEPFLEAARNGMVTVGIADGGNEIGMGRVADLVRRYVPQGQRIASVVPADHLIVAGVSNWGCYGLVGALSLLSGRDLLPSAAAAADAVTRIVAAGAVDGQSWRSEATVDGLPLAKSLSVLEHIRRCIGA